MPGSRGEDGKESRRDRRRSGSRRHRDRDRDRDRDRRREKDREGFWSRLFGGRLCCCTVEKSDKSSRRHRDGERRERRRHRRSRREDDREPPPDLGQDPYAVREGGGASSSAAPRAPRQEDEDSLGGQSARSCVSYASYASFATDATGYSEGDTTARSTVSVQSARRGASKGGASQRSTRESHRDRGQGGGGAPRLLDPPESGSASTRGAKVTTNLSGKKVMNLADLRGGLPPELQKGPKPKRAADDDAQSARSGRSEGGRSAGARSARSEGGQSEGGRSVASVSVKKYMHHLSDQKSPAEVKKLVKEFVKQMVKGREMGVLRADGALKPVMCGLTRSLDVFRIKSGSETRKVKLAEVQRVIHGAPEELSDLETPLDDSCATLELESAECISFKFAERKAAELFTLCMQLFIDGQQGR